jgi:hypothetical protein
MKTFGRICLAFALVTIGCSSSSSGNGSSSGGTSSSSSSGTNSSGGSSGGSCTGDITACTIASLSDGQKGDFCSLLLSSIDAKPGDKFECQSGPNQGEFITVNSKDDCVASKVASGCPIKVGQEIDCYKAVKADACSAFDTQKGACGPLFDDATIKACKP